MYRSLRYVIAFLLVGLCFAPVGAEEEDPGEIPIQAMVRRAIKAGDFEDAISLCEGVLETHPGDHKILTQLAFIYYQKKDMDQAIGFFKEALSARPDYDMAHYGLALVYADLGVNDQARAEFLAVMSSTDQEDLRAAAERAIMDLPE